MNNTIEEIAYFCAEQNTFGALLLSGEWGSGKTYLLEHDLPKRLGRDYAIIRISLFGETSVEAVRKKIQKAYFNELLENIGSCAYEDIADSANAWVFKSGDLSGVEKIFSQNPSEYIKLEPQICRRTVILVFDDLERCHLSQAEILGCINEYCENLHLKTIIVANEEKIKNWQRNVTKNQEAGKIDYLAYSEIKEKIIVKTVRLEANYEVIISNIFRNYRTGQEGYKDFLISAKPEVLGLINDCELKNIRSLQCGFQDFERVYALCRKAGIEDAEIKKYFSSFVLFVLLGKGGRISKSSVYGYGLNRLQQKYPGHYLERYMPNCLKDWALSGIWAEDEVYAEILKNAELKDRNLEPQTLIKSMNLMELDDETLNQGWDEFLRMAYAGELSLDEYVQLVQNLICAREYAYTWPVEPDERKLDEGVANAFARICAEEDANVHLKNRLDEQTLKQCTEAERRIYGKIVHFNDSKAYLYGINRTRILAALHSGEEKDIFQCRNLDTQGLDEELANAFAGCYLRQGSNQHRMSFIDNAERILRNCLANRAKDDAESLRCLESLYNRMKEVCESESGKPLKKVASEYFCGKLGKLLDESRD